MSHAAKCDCGCGQAPAKTTRLRKARCSSCGYIIRLSRDCISRGLPLCPCGAGAIEPECLHDQCAEPGQLGADAYSALCARADDHSQRSENYHRRALKPSRCPDCSAFRPHFAGSDPTHPDPCPRCASTNPAVFASEYTPRDTVLRVKRTHDPIPF